MADEDSNSSKVLPILPDADTTGVYQFSDEGSRQSAIRAVVDGDGNSLPQPDETPPYKKSV
ncbi:MAG TPA: hypothetical protein VMR45_01445 [Patescibacteria group bacterium]|jgi:hypothetical protein|nr:hypothetical protein [Patescibacteria group bacterium]